MALPKRGALHWSQQYFEVGEKARCWRRFSPIHRSRACTVIGIKWNHFGRCSYRVRYRDGKEEVLLLEDLVPADKNWDLTRQVVR